MHKCRYKKLDALLCELKIESAPESWLIHWEHAMEVIPEEELSFLKDDFIREANLVFNLKQEKMEAFYRAFSVIRESPALCQLSWLWHYIIFLCGPAPHKSEISKWPAPTDLMGASSDMLHAVVLASGLPKVQELYKTRGLPYDLMVETLSDLEICMEEYLEVNGVYGIGAFRMGWLLQHFTGKLFRLGRLQFIHKEFDGNVKIFRNTVSGTDAVICDSDVEFRSDGKINGTNGIFKDSNTWRSEYSENDEFILGFPVSPEGLPLKEPVRLPKKEWQMVLAKGDGLLDVHIPSGAALNHEACRKAYASAEHFFSRYFTELRYKGFTCRSWLLSPDLRLLLREDSNIVKFQKDYRLYPILGGNSVFEYVFGSKTGDISTLPEQTSLQRAVKGYLLKGNHINSTGGVILTV